MKIICSLLLVLSTLSLMGQCPSVPQKVNSNYQFRAFGGDSAGRLPKVKATCTNFKDSGMIWWNRIDKKIHWTIDSNTDVTFDSSFLAGYGFPSLSTGFVGDKYYDRKHGFYFTKISSSNWLYSGVLLSDTTYPNDSSIWQGPVLKVQQWSPLAQNWNTGAIQRNANDPSNVGLPYLDDPVLIWGWNVGQGGAPVEPAKAMHIWQHESNFKTNPFVDTPYYEDHISVQYAPGTGGYNLFSAGGGTVREESLLTSQGTGDIYKYNTKNRETWQWPLCPGCQSTTFFDITPTYFTGLVTENIDSIILGNAIIRLNNNNFLTYETFTGTTPKYIMDNSGFNDSFAIQHQSGGDGYFNYAPGGTGVIRLGGQTSFVVIGDPVSSVNWTTWGKANFQMHDVSNPINRSINFGQNPSNSSIFGYYANGTPQANAYVDIANNDVQQYMNVFFRCHQTTGVPDSVVNGVNINCEKTVNGSFAVGNLTGTFGYQLNLNNLNSYQTVFNANTAASGNYLADWYWRSVQTGGSSEIQVAKLSQAGELALGPATNDPSAKLDIQSTTQGFGPPQMTTTQKLAIASPREGLQVYDLTLHQMSYYNGTTWINF